MVRTYRVFGISCDHCKNTIEGELGNLDGVHLVEVDVNTKTVRVGGDAREDEIRAAIAAAGYEVADSV
ncbi:MAG: cation transporter [Acidimicrobiia bacterium]